MSHGFNKDSNAEDPQRPKSSFQALCCFGDVLGEPMMKSKLYTPTVTLSYPVVL